MTTVVRPPVSVPGVLDSFTETWSQRLIASINSEYEMKVAKLQGGFVFHAHPDTDEVFYMLSGTLTIELQGVDLDKVVLNKGDTFVVPRGVQHRPVVEEGIAEVLIVEKAGVINTGDAVGAEHLRKGVADARA
ncbi:RmlC-like cupin domain-containing protein [Mycena albidolilacea]|uniref:RmlC-like cupin domain-containing protein n=1 Tax=Mycena albidolilacea TaxID=1033008 RepID=A0AAD6YWR4_9AGAR|nr:RmlC-like cupin domain-containing protein [Mycena albidolilacea]